MRTYSIYQQPCPSCGLLVSTESTRCKCGYSLVSAVGEALALRDERDAQAKKIRLLRESLASETGAPSLSAQPTEAFRAQQADKVENIMEGFTNTQTKKIGRASCREREENA